ncbi:MAG: UDP-glucose/GDP-mannose dehydrogenase family protein [Acidobacteriota bacterium]|jgi:UDPglucose 6-dehydrogenase
MNIAVVGSGYVGLVTAACFAEFGVRVTSVDIDAEKIAALQEGQVPIFEPGLEELIQRGVKEGRLHFTTDMKAAVEQALAIFIAVGTPPDASGAADLGAVRSVARSIAEHMTEYKVVVTKSTVPMGTGAMIEALIREHRKGDINFDVASNPEFLREGSAIEDFMRPNRVVIGAGSEQAIAILKDLYRPLYLIEAPVLVTDVVTAEMIKYASNAFLAVKISYINEMAILCEKVGADVHQVARGMGLDNRIGKKFLHPGPGYGGSCFPKDTQALRSIGTNNGLELKIVGAAIEANARQEQLMVEKIRTAAGGSLRGVKIAMLGLSFKPNTSDVRESPALAIASRLLEGGATVRAYDPAALEEALEVLPSLERAADEYSAAEGCDLVVLATEWNQFRNLDLQRLRDSLARPVLVDLRNVYEPSEMRETGFRYVGVGR